MGRGAPVGYYVGDNSGMPLPALLERQQPLRALHVRAIPSQIQDYSIARSWLDDCSQASDV